MSTSKKNKKIMGAGVFVVLLVVFGAGIFSLRDTLAQFALKNLHWPYVAVVLDRSDAALAFNLGVQNFGTNFIGNASAAYNLDLAKKAFERANAINPKLDLVHYELARVYFVEGKFERALQEINQELKNNPSNLRSLYIRGLIYGYRDSPGDSARAEGDFTRFVEWAPTEWAGYNDLAWILIREKKFSQAEKILHTGLGEAHDGSENPWLLNDLGIVYLNTQRLPEAHEVFVQALQLSQQLSAADWRQSYPGNNPASAAQSLHVFQAEIKANVEKSTT